MIIFQQHQPDLMYQTVPEMVFSIRNNVKPEPVSAGVSIKKVHKHQRIKKWASLVVKIIKQQQQNKPEIANPGE